MNKLKLIKPNIVYSEQIWEYRTEFLEFGDDLDGCAGLENAKNAEEWLTKIEINSREETVAEGLVPATTYVAIREADNLIVGMIDIRHRLNDSLLNSGGHIGYSVRPTERQKGFAKEMVRQALKECSDTLGLSKVLITCDKENIASVKTILANEGSLENEIIESERVTQRYWISC